MQDNDGQSFSQPSLDSMEEIDSGRGMSIGVVNEGLSISDDQLHRVSCNNQRYECRVEKRLVH